MLKLRLLSGCRHCSEIFHPHFRKLTMLVTNNSNVSLKSISHRSYEFREGLSWYVPTNSCVKFQKYSVNEFCFVRRYLCSDMKEPSSSTPVPEGSWLDMKVKGNIEKKSGTKGSASKKSKRKKQKSSNENSEVKNIPVAIDESFVKDLLGEYESQKDVMFNAAHSSTQVAANADIGSTALDQDDADVFGTVSGALRATPVFEEDEKDEERLEVLPPWNMRERQDEYIEKLQALCNEGDLVRAVAVLEEEMKEEKVKPKLHHFRILIGACAKVGNVDQAFKLFAQLKRRGLAPKPLLFSYLFIACGNARDPSEHLQRVTELRAKMAELQIELSVMNYHAMIIAFGRCGAVDTAFEVFDEMLSNPILPVSTRSFNCLLNACVSEKEVGFRYAIEVWHKMRAMKKKPDIYSFNLLLRCVNDCKSGNPDLLLKFISDLSQPNLLPTNLRSAPEKGNTTAMIPENLPRAFDVIDVVVNERSVPSSGASGMSVHSPKIEEGYNSKVSYNNHDYDNQRNATRRKTTFFGDDFSSAKKSSFAKFEDETSCMSDSQNNEFSADLGTNFNANKNVMEQNSGDFDERIQMVNSTYMERAPEDPVTALINNDEPFQRLTLLGGLSGVLNNMAALRVRPNMKTFMTLLIALPDTLQSEEELLQAMKDVSLTPSTAFCNMLIKKRGLRGDYALAKSTLSLLSKHRLSPDIITYGCLALGCRSFSDALELLKDMEKQGGCPNEIIMLNLVRNAVTSRQYFYCRMLFNQLKKYRLGTHPSFFDLWEEARTHAIADLRKLENDDSPEAEKERKERKLFLQRYNSWLRVAPKPCEKKVKDGPPDISAMLI